MIQTWIKSYKTDRKRRATYERNERMDKRTNVLLLLIRLEIQQEIHKIL